MNNEFKKIKSTNETRYVLENGVTSTGSIATVPGSVGKTQKRGNILAQEAGKDKVDASKPRNFVAKNAKMGGAGAHKDKKKAQKQGDAKHKHANLAEMQSRLNDLKLKFNKLYENTNAEGNDRSIPIGQQMANDGITISPERENEVIGLMSQYMKNSGFSSKEIRYLLSYDEDYISDQLGYLPREGEVAEGRVETPKKYVAPSPTALTTKGAEAKKAKAKQQFLQKKAAMQTKQGVSEGSKIAVDRKTGKVYEPEKEFDKLLKQHKAQFQGMAAIEKAQNQAQKTKPSKGVAEGLVKDIKRGMSGWGAFDKDKPADVVKRVKGQDTDTLKTLSRTGPTGKGSPAELQQKAISRELKKREQQGVAEAGNKPLGTGDTRTPRDIKSQMQGASDEFVKSMADSKTGIFHSNVAKMQGKLAKSELRRREQGVSEGSEEGFSIEDMVMDQYRNGNDVWEIASNMGMSQDEVQDIINDSGRGVAEGVSLKQKHEDKKRADQNQVRYGKMTQAEFDKKWTRTERPKPTDKEQGVAEARSSKQAAIVPDPEMDKILAKHKNAVQAYIDELNDDGYAELDTNLESDLYDYHEARGNVYDHQTHYDISTYITNSLLAYLKNKAKNKGVAEGSAHGYNVVKWYAKWGDQLKLVKWLRKEAGLPKDAPVYFDDSDLVYGDETILRNALADPKLKLNDLLTAVKSATGSTPLTDKGGYYREGSDRSIPIGQQMANDGITISPERENEVIGLMSQYMKNSGYSPKEIRYLLSYDEDYISDQLGYLPREGEVAEVAPKGWEKTVKGMKKHSEIDNPWALAHWMKGKGYKSHKAEGADPYFESLANKLNDLKKK